MIDDLHEALEQNFQELLPERLAEHNEDFLRQVFHVAQLLGIAGHSIVNLAREEFCHRLHQLEQEALVPREYLHILRHLGLSQEDSHNRPHCRNLPDASQTMKRVGHLHQQRLQSHILQDTNDVKKLLSIEISVFAYIGQVYEQLLNVVAENTLLIIEHFS